MVRVASNSVPFCETASDVKCSGMRRQVPRRGFTFTFAHPIHYSFIYALHTIDNTDSPIWFSLSKHYNFSCPHHHPADALQQLRMEDLEFPPGSPVLDNIDEPQGNDDPRDPLDPEIEEESSALTPPLAAPAADTETFADDDGAARDAGPLDDSDNDSELEELDDNQFDDFDASALNIPTQPVQVDADNVALLGVHKRKRTDEEERERKKKKEGRREKPKRAKKVRAGADGDGSDDNFEGGVEIEGKRVRKGKGTGTGGEKVKTVRRAKSPENEEGLTPEERTFTASLYCAPLTMLTSNLGRRRALDRKMDAALKTHRPARRRAGVDLEAMADAEIEAMRQLMANACQADAVARSNGQIATHKLTILPQVVELLNRNTIQQQLVDPDTNILQAVRFMLEPADHDAALPNYQIQRELFSVLSKLNIGKEALVASGVGKVVLFYTKSIQPQPDIKRMAEKLISEWMRRVLNKPKTMRNKPTETRVYDPLASQQLRATQGPSQADKLAMQAERRRKALAPPVPGGPRTRIEGGLGTYTIAPVGTAIAGGAGARRIGTGEEAFRRIAARSSAKAAAAGKK